MNRKALSILALLALTLAAPAAIAQTDVGRWNQPVVAQAVLSLPGGGSLNGNALHLPAGKRVELHVRALDQHGRSFPQERFRFELDFDRGCDGLVDIVSASEGVVTLAAANRSGHCSLHFWIPNNMNLDHQYQVVVGRAATSSGVVTRPATGTVERRDQLLAASLFRALLDRQPDDQWIAAAAQQVAGNETRELIRSLVGSPEFTSRRSNVAAEELLGDLYRGLLGRDPDYQGSRGYLGEIRRGEFEEVVVDILNSEEFRQRMQRELE